MCEDEVNMNKLIESMEALKIDHSRFDEYLCGKDNGINERIALVKDQGEKAQKLTEGQRNDFENFIEQILGCGWWARNDAQHENIKRWWLAHFAKAKLDHGFHTTTMGTMVAKLEERK
jgi:hypothetical protein